ncbi:hypothetical protein ACIA98_43040 [Streptomyces sp. NPDC051366]|uniref:hypothetical protein n=1 Tax=Streptomyces sp. NPDC051366 TaxID=3365652 RepID=UPI0037B5B6DB
MSVYPAELVRPVTVREGLVGFDPEADRGSVHKERLGQFVHWVLNGKVELLTMRRRLWWTSRKSIRAREAWEAARAEEERARQAAEERNRQEAEE